MDSMDLERRDSVHYWHSSMSFCDPRLPKWLATWSTVRSRKEWVDRAEVRACFSMHQELPNAVFRTRGDHVFIEKRACGTFRDWERWERLPHFLCIWRCQNELDGPREVGNILGRLVDGFYEFGSLRFRVLLSFQLGFQLQKLMLVPKTRFRGRDVRLFLPRTGATLFPR